MTHDQYRLQTKFNNTTFMTTALMTNHPQILHKNTLIDIYANRQNSKAILNAIMRMIYKGIKLGS